MTAFDLGNWPAGTFDETPLYNCREAFSTDAGGSPSCNGTMVFTSPHTLDPGVLYRWRVEIVRCDPATISHPMDTQHPFARCLLAPSSHHTNSHDTLFSIAP